jgi:hypothetical protein
MQAIECCAKYLNEELYALKFEKVVFIGKGTSKMLMKKRLLTFDIPPALPYHLETKLMLRTSRKN